MIFQPRILIASTVSMMALCACHPSNPAKAGVAATVNGTTISESRVDLLAKQGGAQGQPVNSELRKRIIEQLSMQFLISQEAINKGLDKKPEVVDQMDLTRQSILANAFVQDYLSRNLISDDMLKAEYEKVRVQMAGSEYKARHILVEKEADAKDIIAKLKQNPKAFEALAKSKSIDTGSKASGGDLGWFDPRGMVQEFGAALTKLTKGQFTQEPVKTQFGYHVIVLDDSRPKVIPALDQIKPQLQQQIQQQSLEKLFDGLKAKAKIDITPTATSAVTPDDKSKHAESSKTTELKK